MSFTKIEDAIKCAERLINEKFNDIIYIYDYRPELLHKYYYVTKEDIQNNKNFVLIKTFKINK